MSLSTSEAAAELGVSPRQMRRAAASGSIVAAKAGAAHAFSPRQVQAHARTAHRGRNWTETTQQAALDLLAEGKTVRLTSTERSRLKRRIRESQVGALAGQILRGRVTLRRAASEESKSRFVSLLVSELGLSTSGGLGVLVAKDASREARKARLGRDDSGDIAVIEGDEAHRKVLEALALYTYGDARESSAAAKWIAVAQAAVDPATARAVQATENVWRRVEAEFGLLSSSEVSDLLGASKANRAYTSELRKRGGLLAAQRKNGYVFPGFQFDHEAGEVRPWVAPLLKLAESNERSPADVIMWMMSPTTYFNGDRPADHASHAQRLLSVAEKAWSIEW